MILPFCTAVLGVHVAQAQASSRMALAVKCSQPVLCGLQNVVSGAASEHAHASL